MRIGLSPDISTESADDRGVPVRIVRCHTRPRPELVTPRDQPQAALEIGRCPAMTTLQTHTSEALQNPLDLLEEIVSANEWAFERSGDDEMAVEYPGHWCGYHMHFVWSEDLNAMHLSCFMDMRVPNKKLNAISELLALVNNKMWLGHFVVPKEETTPVFRHTCLLRGARGVSVEQLEDLVDIALTECERFYPAFQFVTWGGKSADEAVAASLLDTVGEA
jgi:hypothetical protein